LVTSFSWPDSWEQCSSASPRSRIGVSLPELVFVSISNVVSSCDGAVECTEPEAAFVSMHATCSVTMQIIMAVGRWGIVMICSWCSMTVGCRGIALGINRRGMVSSIAIHSRNGMGMASIQNRCIHEDMASIFSRFITHRSVVINISLNRNIQRCNLLLDKDVVKLVMHIVIILLMDLVELIIKGIVTCRKVFNVVKVIIVIIVGMV